MNYLCPFLIFKIESSWQAHIYKYSEHRANKWYKWVNEKWENMYETCFKIVDVVEIMFTKYYI